MKNESLVRKIFESYLRRAVMNDDLDLSTNNKFLAKAVDRAIANDGTVVDASLRYTFNGKYKLMDHEYDSPEEVAELMLLPLRIASHPDLLNKMGEYPKYMPMLTKEMNATLMAVLNSHLNPGVSIEDSIVSHLHWGAFLMAGAPPKYNGYFAGNAQEIGILHQLISQDTGDKRPLYYILLPAAPMVLWPSESHSEDIAAIEELMARVHDGSDGLKGKPELILKSISETVQDWIMEYGQRLSPYMISRFSPHDSTRTDHLPENGNLVKPKGFDELTFKQASILVGELKEQIR